MHIHCLVDVIDGQAVRRYPDQKLLFTRNASPTEFKVKGATAGRRARFTLSAVRLYSKDQVFLSIRVT
jgi:hypothetical protein